MDELRIPVKPTQVFGKCPDCDGRVARDFKLEARKKRIEGKETIWHSCLNCGAEFPYKEVVGIYPRIDWEEVR